MKNNKTAKKLNKYNTLICFVLLLSVFLSGCTGLASESKESGIFFKKEKSEYKLNTNNDGQITDISLISAVIDVINNNASIQEVYYAIPEKHKEDLTLNDFSLFIKALTYPDSNTIREFKRVPSTSKRELIVAITTDISKLALVAEHSEFYELIYNDNSEEEIKISTIIGIQHDTSGNPYLSAEWIRNINKIYEFSNLYFNAIEDRDKDMLSWLLMQSYPQPLDDDVIEIEKNKASLLINYYRFNVKTESNYGTPTLLLPNTIQFSQELEGFKDNNNNFRTCSFKQINNLISVSDPYPEKIKSHHLNVFYDELFLLTWSSNGIRQNYSSFNFNTIMGEPNIRKLNMPDPLDQDDEFWRISYDEISFVIRGQGDNIEKSWSGIIERLEIDENSQNISLGDVKGKPDSLYYNMPLSYFYRQYPFSPEADFIIAGNEQDNNIELIVQIDNEKVNRLILLAVYD
ncbi:MAG TPA: hypothetical protein VFD28_04260 [Candidatus Eisenbacteria bacterium]|nr:hypothetical protein [Candidatus Eisenbacteria bacterium]